MKNHLNALTSVDAIKTEYYKAHAYWRNVLGLERWRVCLNEGAVQGGFAECYADPKYRLANISFDAAAMLGGKFSQLHVESTALHELVHIIVWPLANDVCSPKVPERTISYFEERLVEAITQSMLRTKYGSDNHRLEKLWTSCVNTLPSHANE